MLMKSFGRRILLVLNKQNPVYSNSQCPVQNCKIEQAQIPPWSQVSVKSNLSFVIPWIMFIHHSCYSTVKWFPLFPKQGHAHGTKVMKHRHWHEKKFWIQQGRKRLNEVYWVFYVVFWCSTPGTKLQVPGTYTAALLNLTSLLPSSHPHNTSP